MDFLDLVKLAIEREASDLHITTNAPPALRIDGQLKFLSEIKLTSKTIERIVREILSPKEFDTLNLGGEIDIAYTLTKLGRFRINVYKQQGDFGLAVRIIPRQVPTMEELGLPPILKKLSKLSNGLILVTGPTGSGKTTTLASMINLINMERYCHIITLEDPIEYLHKHKKSIVTQREIGLDSLSFSQALKAALRQDPDVILVGEMRDLETMSIALTAAETGHLVLSTLHTFGAKNAIDRIINVHPPHEQYQIRQQLSSVIRAIISQELLPKSNGQGRVAAFDVMVATPAIRNLIREDKTYQIDNVIQTGKKYGMETMDNYLLKLYRKKMISKETLLARITSQSITKEILL